MSSKSILNDTYVGPSYVKVTADYRGCLASSAV